MLKAVQNIEDLIGGTPLVRLKKIGKNIQPGWWAKKASYDWQSYDLKSELYAKIEFMNPGGSVKDRIARSILDGLEKKGLLKAGGMVVEASSGNTGAGLALCCAVRGYACTIVIPDKMSAEKINALRAYGAKVIISPSTVEPDHPDYYCNVAKKIAEENEGACLADQYFNQDNILAHYQTTGPEIWEQMEGKVDAFVAGIGTGGTLTGTGRFLKEKNPNIKIVAVDPLGSIYNGLIKEGKESEKGRYLTEGVGEDMIPDTMDLKLPEECVVVNDQESFQCTLQLAQREAVFVGGSCGFAAFGALQYLANYERQGGKPLRAVVLLPDSGSRYLSKVFNPEWLQANDISTAGCSVGSVQYLNGTNKIDGVQ